MNMQENSEEIDNVEFNKELEQLLLRSKPDGHGLTVLPFLAGERAVGWAENATGTLAGMRLSTTQTDIYQAFLESIAYRFGLVSRRLMTVLGEESTVIASGGAIKASKYWLQMISDVLGMKVSVSNVEQDTGKGTAILALVALGLKKSFIEILIRVWFGFPVYFVHKFFIRGMFRAGTYGLALSMSSAFGRWLKDIKQYENIIKSKKNK